MSSGRGFRRVARKMYQAVAFGGRGIVSFSAKGVPAVTRFARRAYRSLPYFRISEGGESRKEEEVYGEEGDRFMRHRRECC